VNHQKNILKIEEDVDKVFACVESEPTISFSFATFTFFFSLESSNTSGLTQLPLKKLGFGE
jgi:hypothetical protein